MSWYDDWADEQEKLEKKREDLVRQGEDREIGLIGQCEVAKEIADIDKKLGRK